MAAKDQYQGQRRLSDTQFSWFGKSTKGGKNKPDKDFKVVRSKREKTKALKGHPGFTVNWI